MSAAHEQNLVDRYGHDNVVSDETSGRTRRRRTQRRLASIAAACGVPTVATTGAHFAAPDRGRLAMAVAAVRARTDLDTIEGWLPGVGGAHLRSGDDDAPAARHPGAIDNAVGIAADCAFELGLIAPQPPPFDVPDGYTENSWLRELTMRRARRRYGTPAQHPDAYPPDRTRTGDHRRAELSPLSGGRRHRRLLQGQRHPVPGSGSAANSAVCYALGITNVDPVANKLLFERFPSPARDGPPDIDVDIESDRRGGGHPVRVSALRSRLQRPGGQRDHLPAKVGDPGHGPGVGFASASRTRGAVIRTRRPRRLAELAGEIRGMPRHLGIHPAAW